MENPKMGTLSPSSKEQGGSSQPMLSSPLIGADPSKMSEVDRSVSTLDNSPTPMALNEPCDSKKPDIPNQDGHRDRLYASLKALVTKVVSQLRKSILDDVLDPDPISYRLPEYDDETNVSINKTNPSSSKEVKTRAKTTLVGEETVSFVLPSDCLIGIDLDKNIQHRSFGDRLQGWNIACRQRANGKLDMNYRHGQSRRMFRSTVEVVEFIMEALNDDKMPGSSSAQEQVIATAMKGSSKRKISADKKEKFPPSKSLEISSEEKMTVECFSEESHNKLMNIGSGKSAVPESKEGEKSLKPRSENEDGASGDKETE